MIKRLYVNNFRCLENFELSLSAFSSSLLVGKNGTGKTTVGNALEVLQLIARGTNRVRELIGVKDFAHGRSEVPIRFELEVDIKNVSYHYSLAFELPKSFKELRVAEERLFCDGQTIFARDSSQVTHHRDSDSQSNFVLDWHLVAMPVIHVQSEIDPLHIFKSWLANMLILAPIPQLVRGDSMGNTLMPDKHCTNFGEWFTGLLSHSPAAYGDIDGFLKDIMTDFKDIKNPVIGKNFRSLSIQFQQETASVNFAVEDLSDGEKCFLICAVVLAANKAYGPIFCFWDEPDNYISLSEASFFVTSLRRSFATGGQLLMTSHNSEGIRRFSAENTFVLDRRSHLEPTQVRLLEEIPIEGDLINALIGDDIE